MSDGFRATVLTTALRNWLTALPRWGYTQADELNELLQTHARLVGKSHLPVEALGHERQFQALLEEGLTLESIPHPAKRGLRWEALAQNATPVVHELLSAAGTPEVTKEQFHSHGRELIDKGCYHGLAHIAQKLPDDFAKTTKQSPRLVIFFIMDQWSKAPGKSAPNRKEMLAVLYDSGVEKEELKELAVKMRMAEGNLALLLRAIDTGYEDYLQRKLSPAPLKRSTHRL